MAKLQKTVVIAKVMELAQLGQGNTRDIAEAVYGEVTSSRMNYIKTLAAEAKKLCPSFPEIEHEGTQGKTPAEKAAIKAAKKVAKAKAYAEYLQTLVS